MNECVCKYVSVEEAADSKKNKYIIEIKCVTNGH